MRNCEMTWTEGGSDRIEEGLRRCLHRWFPKLSVQFSTVTRKMTVGDWGEIWLEEHRNQVQASTYSSYRNTLRIVKNYLGEERICDIMPLDISHVQNAMAEEGYGLSQIQKCRIMLNQMFEFAEENGVIRSNPVPKCKAIRDRDGSLTEARYFKDAFTEEEVAKLFSDLPEDLLGLSIRVMLSTGLRVQELLALSPEDIAEDGSVIEVRKAIKTVDGVPELGVPKSRRSMRRVPVPENAQHWAVALRDAGGSKLIWSLPGRNPCYGVGAFRRRYYHALEKVDGVRELSPHCCRHTYITRLQARGVSLELIARLAGHASIVTTEGYTHTSEETLKKVVETLNE